MQGSFLSPFDNLSLFFEYLGRILSHDCSFYRGPALKSRIDARLNPPARDFIASQFTSDMRVLDIGCGNGLAQLAAKQAEPEYEVHPPHSRELDSRTTPWR